MIKNILTSIAVDLIAKLLSYLIRWIIKKYERGDSKEPKRKKRK
jgi:hypothetical protein